MKNAVVRFGQTFVTGALLAGCALAGSMNRINVTLPHAVTVGTTTLPSGNYTLSPLDMADGEYFVIRGEGTPILTLHASKIESGTAGKTEILFSQDGDVWHFEKLFIEGGGTGYQFLNIK